jgi:thioredoxin 1
MRRPYHGKIELSLMSAIIESSAKTFAQDVLLSPSPVLVDFWAEWCNPCKVMLPILEQLAAEKADFLKVVKINTDEYSSLAAKYSIRSIPTLLLFKDGIVIHTMTGARPLPALLKELKDYLGE